MENFNCYDVLEISEDAKMIEIKEQYKKLIKLYHPDKNNNINCNQKYSKIEKAYKILSDINQRKLYDILGIDGMNHADKFGYTIGLEQNPEIIKVPVSLEELYFGCSKTISVERTTSFEEVYSYIKEYGEMKNIQKYIPKNKQTKLIDINIKKGSSELNGQQTININKGDLLSPDFYSKDKTNRDLIIIPVIDDNKYSMRRIFRSKPQDLYLETQISGKESFSGFTKIIKHPKGKNLVFDFDDDFVVNGQVFKIKNEGLPIFDTNKFGDLYLCIKVNYEDISNNEFNKIKNILNPTRKNRINRKNKINNVKLEKTLFNEFDLKSIEKYSNYKDKLLFNEKN